MNDGNELIDGATVLTIRQPWAWLILNAGKDVENRSWPTKFTGRFLIHAASGMTKIEYDEAVKFAFFIAGHSIPIPNPNELERGGIVGSVELDYCRVVDRMLTLWATGPFCFALKEPRKLPFTPCKGSLGFWKFKK